MRKNSHPSRNAQGGFSLVELMISSVLGLLLILTMVNAFLSSRKTIETTQAVGRIQENTRVAFELMARDLREAGGNPCSASVSYGNVLNSYASTWWTQWEDGLYGYDNAALMPGTTTGGQIGNRIAGTDGLDIHSALNADTMVVSKMPVSSAALEVVSNAKFATGDLAVVCDTSEAYVFQVTGLASSTKILHNNGPGFPGNCTKGFVPAHQACNNSAPGYLFGDDATISKVTTTRWYVGNGSDGKIALYRAQVGNKTNGTTPNAVAAVKITQGVTDMEITYRQRGQDDFVVASAVGDWKGVDSVKVRLTVETDVGLSGEQGMGADAAKIKRSMTHVVALRNRIL